MSDDPELTEDGYPTDETLERIAKASPLEALELAERAWHWETYVSRKLSNIEAEMMSRHGDDQERSYIRFATGGWSGNESIIGALRQNIMVCAMCWQLSARGGLHIYELPKSGR